LLIAGIGFIQGPWTLAYPVAGSLLGICALGAALYGHTLGGMALDDAYEQGKLPLPASMSAAFLHLGLLLIFGLLIWQLFPLLPGRILVLDAIPLP
ncbi:MAG: hypothetical protein AABY11_01350, partial [archaeon]